VEVEATDTSGDVPGDVSGPGDVPEEVVAQAKAAFARRTGGHIATLVWDSLVDEGAPPSDHRLRFEHPDVRIDVRIFTGSGSSSVQGQVEPPSPDRVELQAEDGNIMATSTPTAGAFAVEKIPPGVVRLCLVGPGEAGVIRTDWFRI
jgi:hypothetical protein